MLCSDWEGEFLENQFTDFVDGKGIVHDLTCPYTPLQDGMAEREMRKLLTGKKPDLSLARVWGCMVQFLVSEQQRGGKLQPKARWGLHLDVWGSKDGPSSERTQAHPPTNTSTAMLPLLAEVGELSAEDAEDVPSSSPFPTPPAPPLVVDLRGLPPVSASGDEGRRGASPVASAKCIAGERAVTKPTKEQMATGQSAGEPTTEESAGTPTVVQQDAEGSDAGDDGGCVEESTDSDVVEVPPGPRQSGRVRRPPDFYVLSAFTTAYDKVDDDLFYDDAEGDEDLPELDPDMHADLEHRWDISTASVKAAMEEEIRSLIGMGTWELVERPLGGNIMKNRWVLTTKYHIERENARLVVKGFTQVYGADYDETYAPVSSYVTLRIFLSIVAVLDMTLMQLDMKNAFLQSKLDWVLYMYQPDYFNDGLGRVCKLVKSLYGLKQSPLLWYKLLNDLLVGAMWKKSQVDEALYFKVSVDLLAASSSTEMLKELKELLEAAFELREISPLRRRFIDEEHAGRTPKTPVSVGAYAQLTFDDEEAQERQEEYRHKVGSLQFAATTTRPDIAFACSKLGSGLTVRSGQHWREVDCCLAYLANTRDTALEFGGALESLKLVGYVFAYGGAAVSWLRQHIKCATLSSTESEYVAAIEAGKEGLCLRFLLAEFRQLDAGRPTVLRVDNKSAITVAEGMGLTGKFKHMEWRQAWLQHMVKREKFSLKYIRTAE
ncbi:unnamed protein product [Closterium sp. NIES-53]